MLFSEFINEAKSQEFILTKKDVNILTQDFYGHCSNCGKPFTPDSYESYEDDGCCFNCDKFSQPEYYLDINGTLILHDESNSNVKPIEFQFSFIYHAKQNSAPKSFSVAKVHNLKIDTTNKLPKMFDRSSKGSIFNGILKLLNKNLNRIVIKL